MQVISSERNFKAVQQKPLHHIWLVSTFEGTDIGTVNQTTGVIRFNEAQFNSCPEYLRELADLIEEIYAKK